MQAEIERAEGQKEHERQAREWVREEEIPYSPSEAEGDLRAKEALERLIGCELSQKESLELRIETLEENISVHLRERSAELRNDPTVDQDRIADIVRIEMHELRCERDQLYNQLRGLNAELGFGQEIGLECS